MSGRPDEWIVVTEDARTLPVIELLTGRGFVTGKSGSGKSNTASVVAEQLLDGNFNLLVVDLEGEYYGLKEQYQVLHVGADDRCDVAVDPEDADRIADVALHRNVPTVLDVSGYTDVEESKALIHGVLESLYEMERDAQKPFLVIVEEIQEHLPQSGGKDELAKLLIRIAKRGRKRGLGITGISQRPSSVDKDFITQCDWMVWHRLTWKNDIGVVRDILGDEVAGQITELADGEGYLMTDWDETVERVQFKRKETFDAGATPGLQEFERPDLVEVSNELVAAIDDELDAVESAASDGPGDGAGSHDEGQASLSAAAGAEPAATGSADDSTTQAAGGAATAAAESHAAGDGSDASSAVGTAGAAGAADRSEPPSEPPEELAELDREELLSTATADRHRARLLEDEVAELRSVLENVERRGRGQTTRPAFADDASADDGGGAADQRARAAGRGSAGGADEGTGDGAGAAARDAPAIRRPAPPGEPSASGPALFLEEFGNLVRYLFAAVGLALIDAARLLGRGVGGAADRARGARAGTDGRTAAAGGEPRRRAQNAALVGLLGVLLFLLVAAVVYLLYV